jgi:hypothetical protein
VLLIAVGALVYRMLLLTVLGMVVGSDLIRGTDPMAHPTSIPTTATPSSVSPHPLPREERSAWSTQ